MSGKRRHRERQATLAARADRERLDAIDSGLSVDTSASAESGSDDVPEFVTRGYYVDIEFTCRTCSSPQTWTARQQKWWYEVAKGNVFSLALQCRRCRQQARSELEEQRLERERIARAGRKPYRNPEPLLAKTRAEIEPWLRAEGYEFVGRSRRNGGRRLFLEFARGSDCVTISWDRRTARLAVEALTEEGNAFRLIAESDLSNTKSDADVDAHLAQFLRILRSFVHDVRSSDPRPCGGP